jgi:hypothetical protein
VAPIQAKAIADFGSLPEMEGYYKPLHFKAGDTLEIISKEPGGGWWSGSINGKQGLVPQDFVRLEQRQEKEPRTQVARLGGPAVVITDGSSLLSVLMRATEVSDTSSSGLSGIWRVTQTVDASARTPGSRIGERQLGAGPDEPEDYILLMYERAEGDDAHGPALIGAKLSAGRLTNFLEGSVDGDIVTYVQAAMKATLERTGGTLRGEWKMSDGHSCGTLKARRSNDSVPRVALPFGSICNLTFNVRPVSCEPEPEAGEQKRGKQSLGQIVTERAFVHRDICTSFEDSIQLVGKLYPLNGERWSTISDQEFQNPALSRKLEEQLMDTMAVAAVALPSWCRRMVHGAPFLFSQSLRERYIHATAFGPARAVVSLAAQLLESQPPIAGQSHGAAPLDKWTIRRDPADVFLKDVTAMMSARAAQRARTKLEVSLQYRVGGVERGESFAGAGQGVHVAFYTEVARALESIEENSRVPMWMGDSVGRSAAPADSVADASVDAELLPTEDMPFAVAVAAIQADARITGTDKQRYITTFQHRRGEARAAPAAVDSAELDEADDGGATEFTALECELYPAALQWGDCRVASKDDAEMAARCSAVGSRMAMLGQLIATAIMERQLLPLNLSPLWLDVVLRALLPSTVARTFSRPIAHLYVLFVQVVWICRLQKAPKPTSRNWRRVRASVAWRRSGTCWRPASSRQPSGRLTSRAPCSSTRRLGSSWCLAGQSGS